jgi:hypothetical protein
MMPVSRYSASVFRWSICHVVLIFCQFVWDAVPVFRQSTCNIVLVFRWFIYFIVSVFRWSIYNIARTSRRPAYFIILVFRWFTNIIILVFRWSICNAKLAFRRFIYCAELIFRYFIYLFRISILSLSRECEFFLIIPILCLKVDIISARTFIALFCNFRYRIGNIVWSLLSPCVI